MTRKDFELIARVLTNLNGFEIGLKNGTHEAISNAFADELERIHARFDRDIFLKACGVR